MKILDRCRIYLKNPRFPRIPLRRYCHSERVETPKPGWGLNQWVLARPFYRFKRFDLNHIPRASRASALELQLQQWTPYPRSGYYIAWNQGLATVFCWDAERIEQAITGQNLKPSRVRIIPETVLRPPHEEGMRLLGSLQGCEGQIWSQRQLLHSRWWKETPSSQSWLLFQRDAGILPEKQSPSPPVPENLDFLDSSWAKQSGLSALMGEGWRDERLVYLALALLLAPPSGWYAARLHGYLTANERLQAQYQALQQEAGPVAGARGQALQALARIQQLQATDPYPNQLELMALVAEKLLREGDRLVEWNYQDGKLKFTLSTSADTQSSSAMVDVLQSSGLFDNVRSAPGKSPKTVSLEMDVPMLKSGAAPAHV